MTSRMLIGALMAIVLMTSCAYAQNIQFQNTLDTAIDLILTNRQDGSQVRVPINRDGVAPFNFNVQSSVFDIQIMPQDRIGTGFRFDGRDLQAIAANSGGVPVRLGGINRNIRFCYRAGCFGRRCRCYCVSERTAAFIDEPQATGLIRREIVPLFRY